MSEEGEIKGRLRLDTSDFQAALVAAREQLKELTSTRTDVAVRADTAAARKQLESVERAAKDLGREAPRVVIRTDTAAARAQIEAVSRATTSLAVAEGRLRTVQKELADSALRAAASEAALTAALKREDDAAARAAAAELALERAHHEAAAAAVEHAAAEETVEGAIDRVSRRADSGSGRIALWTSAIIAAVPALFPIAGVAIAGTVALGGLGAAGILAGTGIARGFKDGSGAASQYRPLINRVLADVHQLQDTAAVGLLPGADEALDRLQAKLPSINRGVGEMADDLGRMLPTGLDAVVTLTERGVPLWRSGADMLQRMVSGIDDFAHSDAYKGFIDYSVRNGPKVEQFLGHTLELVGDIIMAWAPYGEEVLPVLDDTVVAAGNLIKVLGPLTPMIAAGYLAFRGYTGVRTVLDGITTGLRLMGVEAVATGAKVAASGTGLGAAGGGAAGAAGSGIAAGAGVAAGGALLGAYAIGDVANTGQKMLGVTANGAGRSEADAIKIMAQLAGTAAVGGGSVKSVAQAPGWLRDLRNGATGDLLTAGGDNAGVQASRNAQALDGTFANMASSGNAKKAADMVRQFAAAEHLSKSETAALLPQYTAAAAGLSDTGRAAGSARTELQQWVASTSTAAAAQMKLSGTTQGLEAGQLGARDAIAAAGEALKQNGTSLAANTAKGRANRETVLAAVGSITSYGDALVKSGTSAADARIAEERLGVSLENTLVKMGMSRSAAGAYIAKLLGIPKNVSTKADLDANLAVRQAQRAKAAADAFKAGDYTAALKADPSNMKAKVADAQARANAMAHANYTAFLKANPGNANANVADAARKAHAFAAGAYTAAIRANASQAIATARGAVSTINAMRATIYVAAVATGATNAAQIAKNAVQNRGGSTGGTAGSSSLGTMRALRGLAAGGTGTVSGPGSAASDLAGVYRLANGEEVISNLFGQAAKNRPMLKAINSGDRDQIRQTAAAQYGTGQQAAPQTVQFHFSDDGSVLGVAMRQIAERAIAVQQERDHRTILAGYRPLGL